MAKVGRPSSYTKAIGLEICRRMAEGETLTDVCKDPAMPTRGCVWEWTERYPEFADAYAHARKMLAHCAAEDAHDTAMTSADPQLGRLRFDAKRWLAGKLHYAAYGDKLNLDHSGEVKTALDWSKVDPQALRQIRSALKTVEPEDGNDGA